MSFNPGCDPAISPVPSMRAVAPASAPDAGDAPTPAPDADNAVAAFLRSPYAREMALLIVRKALTLAGPSVTALAGGRDAQIAGYLLTVAGILWSLYRTHKAQVAKAASQNGAQRK